MLKSLNLKNFKAWRELDIEFGKVTALFGENSAGKSSLMQFLLMLKQTKNAADRSLTLDFGGGPAELVNLGDFGTIVHRRRGTDELPDMRWDLEWRLPSELRIRPPADPNGVRFSGEQLKLTTEVGLDAAGGEIARRLAYEFDGTAFELRPKAGGRSRNGNAGARRDFELASSGRSAFSFRRNRGRGWPLPGPVKTHLFPDAARSLFQNTDFLGEFENEYETLMDRIFYLGPLRAHPEREYRWTGAGRDGVGARGEYAIDAILAATRGEWTENLKKHYKKKSFQAMLAHWLKTLGLIRSFEVKEVASGTGIYEARVGRSRGGPMTSLVDVGFGVSQILPVLTLLYYVPKGSIVLLEQPEIHLHPSVQSGLADVMLAVAMHRNVQIVVESHSEHLLRRFLRRVAEESEPNSGQAVRNSDLRLFFVRSDGSHAILDRLRLNEWGGIENWPDDFFGDEFGEISATTQAGLERRINARA